MGEAPSTSPLPTDVPDKVQDLQELQPSAAGEEEAQDGTPEQEEELDGESHALLKELEESQDEVQRMLREQHSQAEELGGLKSKLSSELATLQEEAWKLQVYGELEMLKRQLAALTGFDADLDALEQRMADIDEEEETLLEDQEATLKQEAKPAEGEPEAGLGDDLQDIEELQDDLDAELEAMQKQLEAIRLESAAVTARKAALELELLKLLQEGVDDVEEQLALEEGDGVATVITSPVPAAVPVVAAPTQDVA